MTGVYGGIPAAALLAWRGAHCCYGERQAVTPLGSVKRSCKNNLYLWRAFLFCTNNGGGHRRGGVTAWRHELVNLPFYNGMACLAGVV